MPPPFGSNAGISATPPGVAQFQSGASKAVLGLLDDFGTGLKSATKSGVQFLTDMHSSLSPILGEIHTVGRDIEALGHIGLAFDREDRLGLSHFVEAGRGLQGRVVDAAEHSSDAIRKANEAAEGLANMDVVASGQSRYEELQAQKEKKKKKKRPSDRTTLTQRTRRRRQKGTSFQRMN